MTTNEADTPAFDRPLRIAYVLAQIAGGGSEYQARLLISGVVSRGWAADVFVLAHDPTREVTAWSELPVRRLSSSRGRLFGTIVAAYRLRRVLRAGSYDVVHAILARAHVLAPLVAPAGLPVVAWRRNLGVHVTTRGQLALERVAAKRTAEIIANSHAVAEYWERLLHLDPANLEIIPNALESWRFDPVPPATCSPRPILVSVGGLRAVKGQSVLLDAVAIVRKIWDVELVLVGDGPMRQELREHADTLNIPLRLVGHVPDPRPWLAAATAYVQPSHSEGASNATLEAMAYGCPVVATRTGDAERQLDGCGVLVQPGDARALATGILAVLDDRDSAMALAARARERALGFSTASVVTAHLKAYARLTARS